MSKAIFPHHRSTPVVLQTVPRNQGRADIPAIAVNDAGHGTGGAGSNPILYGLGATVNFEFNSHVRSFTVQVRRGTTVEDVTSQLELVIADSNTTTGASKRYRLCGQAGVFPLGLSTDTSADYATAQEVEFIISMTNISITRESISSMTITSAEDFRHCPSAEVCDVPFFGPLNKAGVRIFDNMVTRDDAANAPVSFYFDQLDALLALAPDSFALLTNYDANATVGIEFTNDGENCGPVISGAAPNCGSLPCCCQIDGRAITVTPADGTNQTLAASFTVTITIPTTGNADCIGWTALEILLPGADTTGGYFEYDDTIAATLTSGVTPVALNATSGLGNNNSRTLVAQAPIACGEDLTLTFNLISARATGALGPQSAGFLQFSDPGACNPENVGVLLPDYSSAGTGGNIDPPSGIPASAASESPLRTVQVATYEVT